MQWKFVCDLWFHEVLQTTIVSQITKLHVKLQRSQTNFHGIKYVNLIHIYYIYFVIE